MEDENLVLAVEKVVDALITANDEDSRVWRVFGRLQAAQVVVSLIEQTSDEDVTHEKFSQWIPVLQRIVDKISKAAKRGADRVAKMQVQEAKRQACNRIRGKDADNTDGIQPARPLNNN